MSSRPNGGAQTAAPKRRRPEVTYPHRLYLHVLFEEKVLGVCLILIHNVAIRKSDAKFCYFYKKVSRNERPVTSNHSFKTVSSHHVEQAAALRSSDFTKNFQCKFGPP